MYYLDDYETFNFSKPSADDHTQQTPTSTELQFIKYFRDTNERLVTYKRALKASIKKMSDLVEKKSKRNLELDYLLNLQQKRNLELDHLLNFNKIRNQELEAILMDNDKVIESLAIKNQYLKSVQLEHAFLENDIKKLRLQIKSAKTLTFGFENLQHLSIQQIQARAENSIKKRRYKEALQHPTMHTLSQTATKSF